MTAYLVFVLGIAVLVYKSTTQKIDLVTTDYYAKELKFQERIDAIKRTESLSAKVKYEVENNNINIILPAEFDSKEVNGNIVLYCPADDTKDIKKGFATTNKTVAIEVPANIKGVYQLQISWVAEGKQYYYEENLFL